MKVIDLLNKIANGEEVPRTIRINNIIYNFTLRSYPIHKLYEDENRKYYWDIQYGFLNDEIKIIEEPQEHKIPKKIEKDEIEISMAIGEQICANKINEIIDYLEEIE